MESSPNLYIPVNEHLYSLIKSLDKSEKRQIKMVLNNTYQKESKRFTQLFDTIDKLQPFSNEVLLHTMQKKHQVPKGQVASLKYSLYQTILKNLRGLYTGKAASFKIRELLDMVEILYQKELHYQSQRLLEKAYKICITEERYEHLYTIYEWRLRLDTYFDIIKNPENNEMKIIASKSRVAQRLLEVNELADRLRWQINTHGCQISHDLDKKVKTILSRSIEEESESNIFLLIAITNLKLNYSLIRNNTTEWQEAFNDLIYRLNSLDASLKKHSAWLNNFLLLHINEKLLLLSEKDLTIFKEVLNNIKTNTNNDIQELSQANQILELTIKLKLQTVDEEHIQQLVNRLMANKKSLISQQYAYSTMHLTAITLLLINKHDECLSITNDILHYHQAEKVITRVDFIRIINLLTHFDLENFGLGEYLIRSIDRNLKNRNYDTGFYKLVLKKVKPIFRDAKTDKEKKRINEFIVALNDQKITLGNSIEYISIKCWALSKVNKSSHSIALFRNNFKNII